MRPIIVVLALMVTLSGCTIREETFAPRDEAPSDGISLAAPGDLNAPAAHDSGSCPGGLARGSDLQVYRDGTQDLFCN
jgi:hypothetical protein